MQQGSGCHLLTRHRGAGFHINIAHLTQATFITGFPPTATFRSCWLLPPLSCSLCAYVWTWPTCGYPRWWCEPCQQLLQAEHKQRQKTWADHFVKPVAATRAEILASVHGWLCLGELGLLCLCKTLVLGHCPGLPVLNTVSLTLEQGPLTTLFRCWCLPTCNFYLNFTATVAKLVTLIAKSEVEGNLFSGSAQQAEAGRPVSMKPFWYTEWVSDQPGRYSKTLSQKNKAKQSKAKQTNENKKQANHWPY